MEKEPNDPPLRISIPNCARPALGCLEARQLTAALMQERCDEGRYTFSWHKVGFFVRYCFPRIMIGIWCVLFFLFFFAFVLPNVEDSLFWPIQSRLVKTVNPASELLFSQECGLLLSASFRLSVFGQSDPHLPALQAPVKVQTRADVGTSHFPIHHHLFSQVKVEESDAKTHF